MKVRSLSMSDSSERDYFAKIMDKPYIGDPFYIAPNRKKLLAELEEAEKSAHLHTDFICVEDDSGEALSCGCGFYNADADFSGIAYFESADDTAAAELLVNTLTDKLRRYGSKEIFAPINFSTWKRYRLMTSNFDIPPFALEPYNPAYYPKLLKRCGFSVKKSYYSSLISGIQETMRPLEKSIAYFFEKGCSIDKINKGAMRNELRRIYEMSLDIFSRNYLYSSISFENFLNLYSGVEMLIKPENVLFARSASGKDEGFAFSLPDVSDALRKMQGKDGLLDKLTFLINKGKTDRLIFKTVGVRPAFRKVRIGSVLVYETHKHALQAGYKEVLHALMSEDNLSRTFSKGCCESFRSYALFYKELL